MSTDYNNLFVPTYARDGAPMVKGKGSCLYDADGKEYVDFGAGIAVNALGHAHPALVKALVAQGKKLIHGSNLYLQQAQIDLAQLLIRHTFGEKVFLCNSGTEANEAAIKFARKWATAQDPDKYHILSFEDGFHGRTYGALSATAQKKFHEGFMPIVEGFHYAPHNDIAAAQAILSQHKFAAIFIEPLQGEGGINTSTNEFLAFLRKYADDNKALLVYDEIQCGMGRTGTLWNYEQNGIVPDMMTLAKPVGGGLPLGAVVCKAWVTEGIKPGDHGTTFGGNPVACALGCEVLRIVSEPKFLEQVRKKGAYLQKKLVKITKGNPLIEGIRGAGLLLGVRFNADAAPLVAVCKTAGLLVIKANHNTVRFIPPLTIKKKEMDKGLEIFAAQLAAWSANQAGK